MKTIQNIEGDHAGRGPRVVLHGGGAVYVSKAAAQALAPHLFESMGVEFVLPDGRRVPADLADGAEIPKAPEEPPQATWIVTEGNDPNISADGEFGVEVNGAPYFYYKYTTTGPSLTQVKYRPILKREFGEVIRRPGALSGRDEAALALARHVIGNPNAARGMGDRPHALYLERERLANRLIDLYSGAGDAAQTEAVRSGTALCDRCGKPALPSEEGKLCKQIGCRGGIRMVPGSPAHRIEIREGDAVRYPPPSARVAERLYEGHSGQMVADVRYDGYFWDETDRCFTRKNTGVPARIAVRAADLVGEGEG